MANFLFTPYRNSMMGKTSDYSARVDVDTDTLKVAFVDQDTATPAAANVFVTSFSSALVPAFASAQTLGTPTIGVSSDGALDAVDTVFTSLSGASVEGIVIWKNVTSVSDSPNLAYFNSGVTGLPFTPTGGDVTIQWHTNGIWAV